MKVNSNVIFAVLLGVAPIITFADIPGEVERSKGKFSNLSLGFLSSYIDFKFNSTMGTNFNRFTGHSNLYSAAMGNVQITPSWTAGMAIFKVNTTVNSQLVLNPGLPSTSEQITHNNTLFGHVLKQFTSQFFLDLAAAYGQNKVSTQSWIINPGVPQIGHAQSHSNSGFASLTALYSRPWNNFVLNANGRLLYSQVSSGRYPFTFAPTFPNQIVEPLTNKALFLVENAELEYKFQPTIMPLNPFINGGLIQVLQFSNSRETINTPINGISPQLNLNKNGYRLGGGLSFYHKQLTIRIEEQYYQSGGTYSSYETIVGLRYMIS